MRVCAEQVWPLLSMQADTLPLTAAAKSASSKITLADLPPNSKATRLILCDANSPTRFPARVDPVKLTISTSGWLAKTSPTSGPVPFTKLKTPAGKPLSWMISAKIMALMGAISLGFKTTVHPAASAGATFKVI